MSKRRMVDKKFLLSFLMAKREENAKLSSFIKIEVNKDKCGEIGIFKYKIKETQETREGSFFLINETHDGVPVDIIYDENARFIGWKNYEENEQGILEIAKDVELDEETLEILESQIELKSMERQENKPGEGRDLASKEHEETKEEEEEKEREKEEEDEEKERDKKEEEKEEKEKEKEKEKEEDEEKKKNDGNKLKNLRNDISLDNRVKIKLNGVINEYYLWQILGIEDSLKDRLPKDISEKSFRDGYLTIIDAKELEAKDGRKRQAEDVFAVCTPSGDIIELDEQVLEPQNLGSIEERQAKEQNRIRYADGKETEKPHSEFDLTRTSKWKIKDVHERYSVNEEWYLGVDFNREWKKNGTMPTTGKLKEISFIQEPRQTDKIYSEDSAEARTRESIEYKLEDISEAELDAKELKQDDQLREKDTDEAINVRKEHQQDLSNIVEKLTARYGESFRNTIEKNVEEEHKKGKAPEEIEKEVNENMEELENEYYIHGRSRNA